MGLSNEYQDGYNEVPRPSHNTSLDKFPSIQEVEYRNLEIRNDTEFQTLIVNNIML